jgi:hypothetical protein
MSNFTQAMPGKSPAKEDNASKSAETINLATFHDTLSKYPNVLERFTKTRELIARSEGVFNLANGFSS